MQEIFYQYFNSYYSFKITRTSFKACNMSVFGHSQKLYFHKSQKFHSCFELCILECILSHQFCLINRLSKQVLQSLYKSATSHLSYVNLRCSNEKNCLQSFNLYAHKNQESQFVAMVMFRVFLTQNYIRQENLNQELQ